MREIPALYDVAREICYEFGMPWTDPRTGVTHPPPKGSVPPKKKAKRVKRIAKRK